MAIDLTSAVKDLHRYSSQELTRILRESEDFTFRCPTEQGKSIKVDSEKLALFLPLHLIATVIESDKNDALFKYVLSGVRLLHSLCDMAPRYTKLEQILLDDVKVSEQIIDLVFYLLIVLDARAQIIDGSDCMSLVHSALTSSMMHLLTGSIFSQWKELAMILTIHPKVDIFMDVAFRVVHRVIQSLQVKLLAPCGEFCSNLNLTSEEIVKYLCMQAEVSLHILLSLCQQKVFRERIVKNEELRRNGGVLMLTHSILLLKTHSQYTESSTVMSYLSRLKAKVLSISSQFFGGDDVTYLDEIVKSGSLDLAKSVAAEVMELLKTMLGKNPKHVNLPSDGTNHRGFLLLNALRMVDILTDDTNFRNQFIYSFTEVLCNICSLPQEDFIPMWCSTDLLVKDEDATVMYDLFGATGWVLNLSDGVSASELKVDIVPNTLRQDTYTKQKTSLFIKIIANLHCFNSDICKEHERDLFRSKFLSYLHSDPLQVKPGFSYKSSGEKAFNIGRNLCSLIAHGDSLIPTYMNEDDLNLLRNFTDEFKFYSELGKCQDDYNSSPEQRKDLFNLSHSLKEGTSESCAFQVEGQIRTNHMDEGDNTVRQDIKEDKDRSSKCGTAGETDRDVQNVEASGSDTSSVRGKVLVDIAGGLAGKDDKVNNGQGTMERQRRKRKRTIMSDEQMALIERALVDEPDMQRNTVSIQAWSDRLTSQGPEVTPSQLRNWLNNRKARLARASKDARTAPEVENANKQAQGQESLGGGSPESLGEQTSNANALTVGTLKTGESKNQKVIAEFLDTGAAKYVMCKPGQNVMLIDGQGKEIGKGKVYQVQGKWNGMDLEEADTCIVVDVVELKADRRERLPFPSGLFGSSFEEAETKFGVTRVRWDLSNMYLLKPQEFK